MSPLSGFVSGVSASVSTFMVMNASWGLLRITAGFFML